MSAPNIPTRIMMFRDFVPDRVRLFLCLFFAVTFQFSGGIYLASVLQMVGSLALMQEDIMMAGYASFVGTTVVFPILFRLKFRFTSRSIFLMVCPALIVCNLITMSTGTVESAAAHARPICPIAESKAYLNAVMGIVYVLCPGPPPVSRYTVSKSLIVQIVEIRVETNMTDIISGNVTFVNVFIVDAPSI